MAILLGLFALVWGAVVVIAPGVPVGAATLEAGAMLAIALSATAIVARSAPDGFGGIAGGPALTFLVLGTFLAQTHWPRYLTLLPGSSLDPAWLAAHVRWAVLLALSLGVLVATARDPATRSWRRPAPQ